MTTIIALYGAGLATYTAVLGRRRGLKRVVVTCGFGYDRQTPDDDPVPVIIISATNVGLRPVEVCGAGFVRTDDGEHIEKAAYTARPSSPPHTLTDGASIRLSYRTIPDVPVESTFEVDKVYVRTSPDGIWFGKPDAWLKPLQMSRKWW